MTPLRNKIRTILLVVIALLLAVDIVLRLSLTAILRKSAIPPAEEAMGVDVALRRATATVFGASGSVRGVEAGNPEGFGEQAMMTVPSIDMDLGLFSLIGGVLNLVQMEVKDTTITIVRNQEGEINAQKLYDAIEALTTEEGEKVEREDAADLPRSKVGRVKMNSRLVYVDHKLEDPPLQLAWLLDAEACNLRTYGDPDDEWGTFSVTGHLEGRPDAFVTDIRGQVAPVADPTRATFRIKGGVSNIPLREFEALTEELSITAKDAKVELDIRCRDGRFWRGQSEVTVRLTKPRMVGKLARKYSSIPLPRHLSVTMPFRGNIEKFREDWPLAIVKTIQNNLVDNVVDKADEAIKGIKVDQKSIEGLINMFFGKKKEKKPESTPDED